MLKLRPKVEQTGPRTFKLLKGLRYKSYPVSVYIPAQFETDFASTPRLLWPLFPPYGKYTVPAIIHDFLYASALGSRLVADTVFLGAMKEYDVPAWKRWTMFFAVRLFGSGHWKRASLSKIS